MIMWWCLFSSGFIEVPSPPLMVVTLEERHTYRCLHPLADGITWRVNGRVLIFPPNIDTSSETLPDGGRVYTLIIGGLIDHNETTIQCEAVRQDATVVAQSPEVIFQIQGAFLTTLTIYIM